MNEQEVLAILESVEAIITDSHIVYTSGRHGTTYISKHMIYPQTEETTSLCLAIAERFVVDKIDAVIAPESCYVLSWCTARFLTLLNSRRVLGIPAEKANHSLIKAESLHELPGSEGVTIVRHPEGIFRIREEFKGYVLGKRILVVDDVLTTGGTARKLVRAVKEADGYAVGLGVLCNRGGVTAEDLEIPKLVALLNLDFQSWSAAECPLCEQNVPINTKVGWGKKFLDRRRMVVE